MTDNVIKPNFSEKPEWIIGPFYPENRVVLDGFVIPKLTANRHQDGSVTIILDRRFGFDFPDDDSAYQAALGMAHAMAIGAGFASFRHGDRPAPFASKAHEIKTEE